MIKKLASTLIICIIIPILTACQSTPVSTNPHAKSAYELAVEQGFNGTLDQWLESLKGETIEGKSAYELAVEQGFNGTLDQWLESLKGETIEGKSAYELAVEQGFNGTLDQWLAVIHRDTIKVNLGNLFDNKFDKSGYINPYTGEEGSSDSLKYTSAYYAFESGTLFFKASKATPSIVFLFYDTDKNYIGYHSFNEETDSICGFGFPGYFRCYTDADFDGQIYFSTNIPEDEVDYSYSLTEVERSTLNKTRLTVVNFGDSIYGNTQHSSSISGSLQRISGHRVYNFAFGGTTMGKREHQDWDKFSFHSIVDSICDGDFSAQKTVLEGDTYFPSYFFTTVATMDTINWNEVDVVTIAYGTNDYNKEIPIQGNDYDVYTYTGAFQYAVKRLQESYPHIRIIAVTPILRFFDDGSCSDTADRSGFGTLVEFKDALLDTAKRMRIPIINAYDELSLSEYNKETYFQTGDGCHLNERGRLMYASLLKFKIEEVCGDLLVTGTDKIYGE